VGRTGGWRVEGLAVSVYVLFSTFYLENVEVALHGDEKALHSLLLLRHGGAAGGDGRHDFDEPLEGLVERMSSIFVGERSVCAVDAPSQTLFESNAISLGVKLHATRKRLQLREGAVR
jgi:hypothetical protein